MKVCLVEYCGSTLHGKGYCNKHYQRLIKGKDILAITTKDPRPAILVEGEWRIPLGLNGKNGHSIVDKKYIYLSRYKWDINKKGYAAGWIDGKSRLLHHMIIGLPPKGFVTDHKDRDKLNNKFSNLRHVTNTQNSMNRRESIICKSGYKGVHKHNNKWRATIKYGSKAIHIGLFDTKNEAAKAYDRVAKKIYGEYAWLNFGRSL